MRTRLFLEKSLYGERLERFSLELVECGLEKMSASVGEGWWASDLELKANREDVWMGKSRDT